MPILAWWAVAGIATFAGGVFAGSSISGIIKPVVIGGVVYYVYMQVKK